MGDGATLDLAIKIAKAVVDGSPFVEIAGTLIGTTLAAHIVTAPIIGSRLWIVVTSYFDVISVDNAASKITKRWIGLCGVGVVVARSRDGTSNDN